MIAAALTSVTVTPDELRRVQRARKWALLSFFMLILLPLAVTDSYWYSRNPALYYFIETFGLALILACIAGRTWCSLYIGGRKKRELVTVGPYSIVRNPLYVFTVAGAFGIGAQSGSLLVAICFALGTFLVFHHVVRREEQYLAGEFPGDFRAYSNQVHRFWPNLANWQDVGELTVRPDLVKRTFLDACLFLLSIPAAETLEVMQRLGLIPIFLHLP